MTDKPADGSDSIFKRYYSEEPFQDRFLNQPSDAVDVIVPVIHTNELWEANLRSFYREIPINRLLIGDGGCIDDSLEIAKKFPRVVVFDHRNYVSLGYSIRKLIEEVETEWFVYPHSDVYLPDGWFDTMKKHQSEYDWFGCPMRHTVMVEYSSQDENRPYAGSQMGRKKAFAGSLHRIDDDYVYRQEDFVFAELIKQSGFSEGRVSDTFHYHQTMHKESAWSRRIRKVAIDVEWSRKEEVRAAMMQVKGVLKYLNPSPFYFSWIEPEIARLMELGEMDWPHFINFISSVNPSWLPYVKRWRIELRRMLVSERVRNAMKGMFRLITRS